jgi:dinuclear metal center YbgI/SA1388 family protein
MEYPSIENEHCSEQAGERGPDKTLDEISQGGSHLFLWAGQAVSSASSSQHDKGDFMSVTRDRLLAALDDLLQPAKFRDYCPNGLQVEGRYEIRRLVSGVTACQALLDAAVDWQADAILVHHGYFWRGEADPLVGMKARRIRTLLTNDISLFAYHLPLDCHPTLGNNAGLGRALGVETFASLDPTDDTLPVFVGELPESIAQSQIASQLEAALGRSVVSVAERPVRRIAWCTGGGQSYIEVAADAGADLFVSGEISEQTVHVARERGIGFIAAGHHATERFGAREVGTWASREFALEHQFIDIDSPA